MDGVWLSVDSDDPAGDLEEPADWLRHEPKLRVAVGSGGVVSVLVASLKVFFAQQDGSA